MSAAVGWSWDDDERGIRHLAFRGTEVARALFAVLRDENWDTPEARDLVRSLDEEPDAATLTLRGRLAAADVSGMTFELTVHLSRDGRATVGFRGAFEDAIRYNRAGICLCLPPDFAGARVEGAVGDAEFTAELPERIGPQLLVDGRLHGVIPPFDRIGLRATGIGLDAVFTGDVFEMEDQRNWSDASFKIYSTPLASAWPFVSAPGQVVEQSVDLTLRIDATGPVRALARLERVALPPIGLQTADGPLTANPDAVRSLAPDHLRVDVDVPGPLEAAVERVAAAAGIAPVELALRVHGEPASALVELRRTLDDHGTSLARVIVIRPERKTVDARAVDLVRAAFDGVAPIGGGSDAYFAEVNRGPLDAEALDFVSFSISPQVHDPESTPVLETLPVQAEIVRSARAAFGRPAVLSTVTLRPRFNPNATAPGGQELGGPDSIDPRQGTEFAAAWMLGAVAESAAAGAASLTLYEVDGPRGVLAGGGDPLATPEARALIALRALGIEVLILRDPARGAYVLASPDRGRAIVVNRSRHPLTVTAAGWAPGSTTLAEGAVVYLERVERADGDVPLDDAEVATWWDAPSA